MNVSAPLRVDKAAFFRFLAAQAEGRYEYDRGRIVQQMTGGTFAHSLVSQRFISAFERRLDINIWAVTGHSRGVETPVTVRYPDVLVEPMLAALDGLSTRTPAVVVEVLSPTTVEMDLNVKLPEYRGIPSLHAYIVANQDEARCWLWLRGGAENVLPELPEEIEGLGRVVDIPALALSIPLEEIYRGIVR
jgi:Uma2 family endonuclease